MKSVSVGAASDVKRTIPRVALPGKGNIYFNAGRTECAPGQEVEYEGKRDGLFRCPV
ncbi:MAG: hypothetical protein NTZ24_01495 [Deltaproteobacteria bacterium]|nr:hypothetical protein [Deltaproteobacteria bacterium]